MNYCTRKPLEKLESRLGRSSICDIFIAGKLLEQLSKYLGETGIFCFPDNESAIEIRKFKLFEQTRWEF